MTTLNHPKQKVSCSDTQWHAEMDNLKSILKTAQSERAKDLARRMLDFYELELQTRHARHDINDMIDPFFSLQASSL